MSKVKNLSDIPFSVLDLAPVLAGKTPADSFHNSLDLARHVERWGYKRYWLAEHHNMPGIASTATAVLIGYIAGGTTSIRVGSGGIMLPNHAPLVVAEQFGTLATLYPGRIDLGLGRAPGTDPQTAKALRRNLLGTVDDFPDHVEELMRYLSADNSRSPVRAFPGEGLDLPVWLLGSSTFGAQLAGLLGRPFVFASHFAPAYLHEALRIYRDSFRPSGDLREPYVGVAANAVVADSDSEARLLATSLYAAFLNVIRGTPGLLQPPTEELESRWDSAEKYAVQQMLRISFIGAPETVKENLQELVQVTRADEIIFNSHIYDQAARLRSYELLAGMK